MEVGIGHYLTLSAVLFTLGVFGIFFVFRVEPFGGVAAGSHLE